MSSTLIDEYGDTGILQPPYEENRRDGSGRQLGPKPKDERSYDERQLPSGWRIGGGASVTVTITSPNIDAGLSVEFSQKQEPEPAKADTQGNAIEGP